MNKQIIVKKSKLEGIISIDAAKNSTLPIMAATILAKGECVLSDIPYISDVKHMIEILENLGANVSYENKQLKIDTRNLKNDPISYEMASKMRASFLILGPMLSRFNQLEIGMPGGCSIGVRPIDLHLKGFEALGAKLVNHHGNIRAEADSLIGAKIYLDFPSVGATENIMMASVTAKGVTFIENAACEPEIVDLSYFLNKMGADIKGAGTSKIKITGKEFLNPTDHKVIPDRIEAGTYMAAAAITGGDIMVKNVIPSHIMPMIRKLNEIGCKVDEGGDYVRVQGPKLLKSTDIKTMPYPGFPTDLQSIFMPLMSIASGTSVITETIFENRFMVAGELQKMGANIKIDSKSAVIRGISELEGCSVSATDLRSGAALILAGLSADGYTTVHEVEHIQRGYFEIVEKLKKVGANINLM